MQTLKEKGTEEDQQVLMPILDVRTRWSSMHQMLNNSHFDDWKTSSSPGP
jgi:hypothetical protein